MKDPLVTSFGKSSSARSRTSSIMAYPALTHHRRNLAYSPTLQRWMQQDPMGYLDGLNSYQALENNPIRQVDPSGKVPPEGIFAGVVKGQPRMSGRGSFNISLAHDDNYHSFAQIKFTPSEKVKTDGTCDEIKFLQFYSEQSGYNIAGLVPLPIPWDSSGNFTLDLSNPFPWYKYTRSVWTTTGKVVASQMDDTPGDDGNPLGGHTAWLVQSFRTYAVATKGKEAGSIYGEVMWGHSFDFSKGTVTRWIVGGGSKSGTISDPSVSIGPVDLKE